MVTCCACLQPSIHLGKGRKQLTTTPVQLPDTASAASQRAVFSSRDPVRANQKAGKLPIKAGTVVQCGVLIYKFMNITSIYHDLSRGNVL